MRRGQHANRDEDRTARTRRETAVTLKAVRGDRGMVTAETAIVLPVVVVVALFLFWATTAASAHMRLVDASREAARMVARGDAEPKALAAAQRLAPRGTEFSVRTTQGHVRVDAQLDARLDAPLLRKVFSIRLRTSAITVAEHP